MKTLTVTITNLEDSLYEDVWKTAAKIAKSDFGGWNVKPNNKMKIDLQKLEDLAGSNAMGELLSIVLSCYVVANCPVENLSKIKQS